jgi:hypothetical protein
MKGTAVAHSVVSRARTVGWLPALNGPLIQIPRSMTIHAAAAHDAGQDVIAEALRAFLARKGGR